MKINDFVNSIAEQTGQTQVATRDFITAFTDTVSSVMKAGDSINLANFGTFSGKPRSARTGRNPSSGEAVAIPAKIVPNFKPSSILKGNINE